MKRMLYLIRHGATAANLVQPAKLQGRNHNPPLAPGGVLQAQATRDILGVFPIEAVFSSPLLRAQQTAEIVAQPHCLPVQLVEELTECDVGVWEGQSWEEIRAKEPALYQAYMQDPALQGYKGGENFAQVYERTCRAITQILATTQARDILIVSHHIVTRTYLAGVFGLGPSRARQISVDNCAISLVQCEAEKQTVITFNSRFHLQGIPLEKE